LVLRKTPGNCINKLLTIVDDFNGMVVRRSVKSLEKKFLVVSIIFSYQYKIVRMHDIFQLRQVQFDPPGFKMVSDSNVPAKLRWEFDVILQN
jgi:hypothetical protein